MRWCVSVESGRGHGLVSIHKDRGASLLGRDGVVRDEAGVVRVVSIQGEPGGGDLRWLLVKSCKSMILLIII